MSNITVSLLIPSERKVQRFLSALKKIKDYSPVNNGSIIVTTIVSKKVRKSDDQEDYEKVDLKDILDDAEKTKKETLESLL